MLLRWKIPVERASRDLGFRRDFIDGSVLEALFFEQIDGGLDDGPTDLGLFVAAGEWAFFHTVIFAEMASCVKRNSVPSPSMSRP
jgi:hypothetical protein